MPCTLAGLASTSAYAADAVFEEPPAPVVVEVPIFIWTGGYLGLQGGGLWSDNSINEPDTGVFSDNFNGGLFGAYAGYNWQSGAWVFGVEGDVNGSGTTKRLASMASTWMSAATIWPRCGAAWAMRSTAPLFSPLVV